MEDKMSGENRSEIEKSWLHLDPKPDEKPDLENWLASDTEGEDISDFDDAFDEDCQAGLDDLIEDGMKHLGNNRYHQPKSVAKAKRKAAKKSKQKNRKKK